jgi:hypothetical protein
MSRENSDDKHVDNYDDDDGHDDDDNDDDDDDNEVLDNVFAKAIDSVMQAIVITIGT